MSQVAKGSRPRVVTFVKTQVYARARRFAPDRILGSLCVCILFGMLVAGLWPFHRPRNDVTWLRNTDGVKIGDYGTLLSSSTFDRYDSEGQAPCSLEIWLQPYETNVTGTLLALHYPAQNIQTFSLRQDGPDLELNVERRDAQHRTISSRTFVNNVFRKGEPAFLTIASGEQGTIVYRNGVSIKTSPWFRMSSVDLTGQLVVGTSPFENDSWSGQLRGLAIYKQELTPAEVLRHYYTLATKGRYPVENERAAALYLFDEHSGNVVHDHGTSRVDLYIPEKYTILHEKLLEPAWREFDLRWGYWKRALINVFGFIPFGFFFCAYLSLTKPLNRAAVATVGLGLIVSLTIEVLQAYLPTRDSGTTDLITNTLGTALGVMLYRWKPSLLTETLNRIPFTKA
jgi:hypothetical protein